MTNTKVLQKLANEIPQIGVITTKSIGPVHRLGNREPIITQYSPGSFMNAVGLTNPGAEEFAKQLRLIRSNGIVKKQFYNSDMVSMGYNFRMNEISASLGITQLKKLDKFLKIRENIARYYDERFKNNKLFITTKIDTNTVSSRHLYPIVLNPELHCPKEDIFKELQENGLGVQVHYKPIYQNSFYKEKFANISLEVANDFYRSEISLPCHQKMSMQDAKYVADTFLSIIQRYSHRGCSF
jgi:UDP-4-amino-4,6-dideoxy-L-N-acetyl-beta-L-altrosamine transaminase